mmetsp:Transcript_6904/g.16533  ORF Transcript_6904/g.16533 Transcript_6904/m.16533 type:complete len:240 (-) Transcript_6904:1872-2591(-)
MAATARFRVLLQLQGLQALLCCLVVLSRHRQCLLQLRGPHRCCSTICLLGRQRRLQLIALACQHILRSRKPPAIALLFQQPGLQALVVTYLALDFRLHSAEVSLLACKPCPQRGCLLLCSCQLLTLAAGVLRLRHHACFQCFDVCLQSPGLSSARPQVRCCIRCLLVPLAQHVCHNIQERMQMLQRLRPCSCHKPRQVAAAAASVAAMAGTTAVAGPLLGRHLRMPFRCCLLLLLWLLG